MLQKPDCVAALSKKSVILVVLISATFSTAAEEPQKPSTAMELPDMDVIGTTPIHGVGLPVESIPANVQSATAEDLETITKP